MIFARIDKIQDVLDQGVLVLVSHPSDIVSHISSVMSDQELVASWLEVRVRRQHGRPLNERVIRSRGIGMGGGGSIVQSGKDPSRSLILDQSADDGIIEVW